MATNFQTDDCYGLHCTPHLDGDVDWFLSSASRALHLDPHLPPIPDPLPPALDPLARAARISLPPLVIVELVQGTLLPVAFIRPLPLRLLPLLSAAGLLVHLQLEPRQQVQAALVVLGQREVRRADARILRLGKQLEALDRALAVPLGLLFELGAGEGYVWEVVGE